MVRDINGLGSNGVKNAGDARTERKAQKPVDGSDAASGKAPAREAKADDVQLSSQAQQLGALAEKVSQLPDVDASRVAAVREKLARNELQIDNQRLAEKLLNSDDLFNG